jgi:16S rRNA (guanine527-N7)-methyltransferase
MTPSVPTTEVRLQQFFAAAGRPLDELRQQQFLNYLRELQQWNRTMSLTSISDEVGIIRKHFLGSLDFLQTFDPHPGLPVLDVGTGAGFPGLPLKLWCPELAVDLVESSERKSVFLRQLCRVLEVGDVRCLVTRVEALAREETMRDYYAVIVSRGVGGLRRWLPAALTLLRTGGRLVLEKGPAALAEVHSLGSVLAARGGILLDLMSIPGESAGRTMVVIGKPSAGQKFDNPG